MTANLSTQTNKYHVQNPARKHESACQLVHVSHTYGLLVLLSARSTLTLTLEWFIVTISSTTPSSRVRRNAGYLRTHHTLREAMEAKPSVTIRVQHIFSPTHDQSRNTSRSLDSTAGSHHPILQRPWPSEIPWISNLKEHLQSEKKPPQRPSDPIWRESWYFQVYLPDMDLTD